MDAMDATTAPPAPPAVTTPELFTAFLKVGLSGFGGVLPFARRMLVEQRKWLTELEFNEVLSLSQFLPGPNIVNVTVIVGRRFQGVAGAVAATLGLMLMPMVIVLALAAVYARFAQIAAVRSATHAVSAAAAGLIIAVGFDGRTSARTLAGRNRRGGVRGDRPGRLPLLWVLAALAPLAVGVAWWTRR
jgi:chromate transporter